MNKRYIFVGFLAVMLVFSYFAMKDNFTSPGTMVQLASSHVPTQEDVDYYKYVYPRMVRHDLADMTGEDPGPIRVPYPQLWF